MGLLTDTVFSIANTFVFWAAWIVIPIIMEIIPSLRSLYVLVKRKITKSELPTPPIWPEITLIVPVYNSADSLENCIGSIDASTYPNDRIRVFCVDNKSSDDSFGAFSRAQKSYGGLIMQWMRSDQGKSRALNTAIYNSTSKYVINVDSDGILERHALENMVKLFESDDTVSCATGAILVQPELIEEYPRGLSRLFRKLEFVEYGQAFLAGRNAASETNSVYTLSGAFSAFRCSAIRKSWMYNTETLAEDTHVTFQMRYMLGEQVRECEDALFLVDPIEGVDKLYTQRQRWQRGSLEVAKMFGGDRLKAHKLFSDVSVNTLMYDHTFAFPRVIWYLALFCMLFLGYSGTMVLGAMGIIFLLYIVMGYFYFFTSLGFLSKFPELKRYYRKQWWVVALLPFFNLAVFFIRLAGIINSIGTTSSWKTKTLTEEREDFLSVVRRDTQRARSAGKRMSGVFSTLKRDPKHAMRKGSRARAALGAIAALVAYAAVAVGFVYVVYQTGNYPDGADTMFYVYRGDFLYRQILEQGNWYPLWDPEWYNGVQTFRYWSPMPAYLLAATQAIMGGNEFTGYLLFLGCLYFACAVAWLYLGFRFRRPWMGFFIGLIWFFVPNNVFMLFIEGVVARSLAMCAMPLFVAFVYDYLNTRRWANLPKIMACFLFIAMCHLGWAGMLAIALFIFLAAYAVLNRKRDHGPIRNIVGACVFSVLVSGVWAFASLRGGITSIDSSQVMALFFQPLVVTLDPFYGIEGGSWNRWLNPGSDSSAYFGLATFVLAVVGTFLSNRRVAPGFLTAAVICLLTSTIAYTVLVELPGSSYLWMLRFISIALTFLFVSFFFWRELRVGWQGLVCGLLALQVAAASVLYVLPSAYPTPEEYFDSVRENALIGAGEQLTEQRFSAIEPYLSILDAIYVMAGYGPDAKPTSYGQGVQSAVTYRNIVQINEAAEKGLYYYMFDRLLELGNDTLVMPVSQVRNTPRYDAARLASAAAASGYELVESNGEVNLYHRGDIAGTFGLKSTYDVLGVGRSVSSLAMHFPAIEEGAETDLNAYSYEYLAKYKLIVLSDFTVTDRAAAEDMIRRLAANGTRIVIMADGVPTEEETQTQVFLGVDCQTINFRNGYPPLTTVDGVLYTDLFPAEYVDWKTRYVNGLTDVWGTIENEGRTLDFMGTKDDDNIVFIGLGLSFFESLTQDKGVARLLERALALDESELPERRVVPLELSYEPRSIQITSPEDDVNSTLAFHDIFSSEQPIWDVNNLLYVNEGTTVVRLSYPYLVPGLVVTGAGIVLSVVFLATTRASTRRREQEGGHERAAGRMGAGE